MQRSYDDRIIEYFNIGEYGEKPHLLVDITEDNSLCYDILAEMEHLLRVRYTLGARIYNHHTKIAADAMIGKAISETNLNEDDLREMGDEVLLMYLQREENESIVSKTLARNFMNRELLSRAYMLDAETFGGNPVKFTNKYRKEGRIRENWKEHENKIIDLCKKRGISIDDHELIIWCHEPDMNLKAANVLVKEQNKPPRRLSEYHPVVKTIMGDHSWSSPKNLWIE